MSIQVHALASGSSGNSTLIQAHGTNIVIDAGVPVRTLASHLGKRGVGTDNLHAILLTHEHGDHSGNAGPLARRTNAPVIANRATLEEYSRREALPFPSLEMPTGHTVRIGETTIRSFAVPHDAVEPAGYIIEAAGCKIVYFTDAGTVTPAMKAALAGATFAVVEANHDLQWLMRGSYTPDMKQRVSSETGHLSNADCARMLAERLDEGGPMSVWLAHLSRANNSPSLARRSVTQSIQAYTHTPFTLDVALRDHPSVTWRPGATAVQLALI